MIRNIEFRTLYTGKPLELFHYSGDAKGSPENFTHNHELQIIRDQVNFMRGQNLVAATLYRGNSKNASQFSNPEWTYFNANKQQLDCPCLDSLIVKGYRESFKTVTYTSRIAESPVVRLFAVTTAVSGDCSLVTAYGTKDSLDLFIRGHQDFLRWLIY